MGVDIDTIGFGNACLLGGNLNGACSALAVRPRCGNVVCIAGVPISTDLRIDFRAALFCMLILFKHEDSRSLANYKSLAARIKGQRSGIRILA